MKFRNEIKYYINFKEYNILKSKLKLILKLDKNSSKNGDYKIRSLYFDDKQSSSLFEKQAGIINRKKYRFRIYNDNKKLIKLEKKSRKGNFINKKSVILNYKKVIDIINLNYDFLKNSNEELLKEFYYEIRSNYLRPNVIVDYYREAYVSDINNIRITFDKYLQSGLFSINFLEKIPMINILEEPLMIMEIKFDNFLPDFIKNLIQIETSRRYAISKYVLSKKHTKLNSWEDN